MTTPIADPSTYAKLPAGTRFLTGAVDAETADLKLLKDATAIGATGKPAAFIDATRLIDTESKSMADMTEGPEKEFVFLDDPGDADLTAFLASVDKNETVKVRIEFPNNRWADMTIVLGSWSMQDLEKGKPMMIVVTAKQNAILRGVTTPAA